MEALIRPGKIPSNKEIAHFWVGKYTDDGSVLRSSDSARKTFLKFKRITTCLDFVKGYQITCSTRARVAT